MYKVMIIDDEWIVREGLKRTIPWQEMGCVIIADAADSEEALKLIEELRPDIVLSDIRMPGMDGLELVGVINSKYPDIQAIFLTGFDDFTFAQQALKLGASDILLKPSNPVEIRRAFTETTSKLAAARQQAAYLQNLESMKRTSQPFILEKVIHHLFNDKAGADDLNLLYEHLQGNLESFHAFRVAIIDYGQSRSAAGQGMGSLLELSAIGKLLTDYSFLMPVQVGAGSYAVLLVESAEKPWEIELRQVIESQNEQGVTVSVSQVHHGLLTLARAYEEARLAQLYQALHRQSVLIHYASIANEAHSFLSWDEAELVEAVKWGSAEDLKEKLQALYKVLLWQSESKRLEQQQIGSQLAFGVYNLLTRHFPNTTGLPDMKQFLENMSLRPSMEHLMDGLEQMASEVQRNYMASKQQNKSELDEILDYIHEHYTEDLVMYEFALQLHMSESKFSKVFKKKVGKSFMDYIIELRINKAKELLMEPEVRIGEIAAMIGYQDSRYFSQLFKRATGEHQKSFREKLQKLNNPTEI